MKYFFAKNTHTRAYPSCRDIYIDWIQKYSIRRVSYLIPVHNYFCLNNIMFFLYLQFCFLLNFLFFCGSHSHAHIEFFSHVRTIRIFERSNVRRSTKNCLTAKSTRGQRIIMVRILSFSPLYSMVLDNVWKTVLTVIIRYT